MKLLLLILTLLPLSASADSIINPQGGAFLIPADKMDRADVSRVWTKPSSYGQGGVGTTCNLIFTGSGIVPGVQVSGVADTYLVLFDSDTIAGLSAATPDTTKLIARLAADTAKYSGFYEYLAPLPFASGLVACPSASTVYSVTRYYKQRQ